MKCSAVTLNCCLSVRPPLRYNGADPRASRLVDALYSSIAPFDLDIVCLQELIAKRDTILTNFIHHPYHTQKVISSWFGSNIRILHAGLAIVSRWPILEEDAHVFSGKTYHAEAFMAKAVQYAKIYLHNKYIVHVFNVHLQAWTNARAKAIRHEQMRQTHVFMKRKLAAVCLKTQLVMLAGDYNVDAFEHAEDMHALMETVKMNLIMPTGPQQFSFDPSLNPLVGTDDATEYATRSKLNGCYDDYLLHGTCSCCPKQLVDGIATLKDQQENGFILQAVATVVPILAQTPFQINVDMGTRRVIETISDHFAVRVQFELMKIGRLKTPTAPYHNSFQSDLHLGWILFEIIVLLCLIFLFWLFCMWACI